MANASEESRAWTATETGFSARPLAPQGLITGNPIPAHVANAIKFNCVFTPGPNSVASMIQAQMQQAETSNGPWETYGGIQPILGSVNVGNALMPQVSNVVPFQTAYVQLQQPVVNPPVTNWSWSIDGSHPLCPRLNCNFVRLVVICLGATAGDTFTVTARTKRFVG